MRRVVLVASGAEGDAAATWLDGVAEIVAVRASALADIDLASADVVWVHGACEPGWEGPLLDWLGGGGRVLATLGGARLPYDIGLEPAAPELLAPSPEPTGMAALGPHPLFRGVAHGLTPTASVSDDAICYRDGGPGVARVVTVAWTGDGVDSGCALAWELRTADGGVLAIGAGVGLAAPAPRRGEVEALLHNAVAGDAIPHRDRAGPAALWPRRRTAVAPARRDDGVPIPRVPDFAAEWPANDNSVAWAAATQREWSHAGRRLLLAGTAVGGLREAWAHPFRFVSGARVRFVDRDVEPTAVYTDAAGVERILPVGAYRVVDRLVAALELPLFLRELVADGDVFIDMEWLVDFRRTAPYRLRADGALVWNVSEGGRRLWVGAEGGTAQAVYAAEGGRFEADAGPDGSVQVRCRATRSCRIIAIAAEDQADLDRSLDLLARRGFGGLRRRREQHLDRLIRYGLEVETGDPLVDSAFRRAAVDIDAALVDSPPAGRSVADLRTPMRASLATVEAAVVAEAALATGNREVARDVLRFLHRGRALGGLPIARLSTSGLAMELAADDRVRDALTARYVAWTADTDLVPLPTSPPRAPTAGLGGPASEWRFEPAGLESGDALAGAIQVLAFMRDVLGIRPDAPAGLLELRLAVPAVWDRLRIRRLRVGTTQLELEIRRRPGRTVVRVHKVVGPAITVEIALAGNPSAAVVLDDEPLGGARARFEAHGHHEVVFHVAS